MLRHFKHNYVAHVLDGGLYLGGMAFLSAAVIMPKVVQELGGPELAVALTPNITMLGFMTTPLLTAHRIERLKRHKPALMLFGVFQRLPYLLTGLLLLLMPGAMGSHGWVPVMLCPLLTSIFGGIGISAWQELVSNTIPVERRSSMMAVRHMSSMVLGIGSGVAVHAILSAWPGVRGIGLLHLITFGFLVASYAAFGMIRETPNPRMPVDKHRGLLESFSIIPSLLRRHREVRIFLLNQVLSASHCIMLPVMTIYALRTLGVKPAYAGLLSSWQMAGGMAGSLLAGWLGDKYGPKSAMRLAILCWLGVCGWMLGAEGKTAFSLIFFLSGMALFLRNVGGTALMLEIVPLDNRIRFLAIISIASLVGALGASGLNYLGWTLSGQTFSVVCLMTMAAQGVGLFVLSKLPDTRANAAGDD